jgi:cell envelope opacity-associated protein A
MKRNKLLSTSPKARLFSSEKPAHSKRRHLLMLSSLTVVGVFLTTMVLATSAPVSTDTKSQSLQLPGQTPALPEQTTSQTTSQALPPVTKENETSAAVTGVNAPAVARVPVPDSEQIEVAEPAQLEQLHLEQVQQPETDVAAPVAEEADLTTEVSDLRWEEVTVASGDNLSLLFPKVGLSARDVYNVAQTGDSIKPLLSLKPG